MSKLAECLCINFWEWDDWSLSPDADSIGKCCSEMRDEYWKSWTLQISSNQ